MALEVHVSLLICQTIDSQVPFYKSGLALTGFKRILTLINLFLVIWEHRMLGHLAKYVIHYGVCFVLSWSSYLKEKRNLLSKRKDMTFICIRAWNEMLINSELIEVKKKTKLTEKLQLCLSIQRISFEDN